MKCAFIFRFIMTLRLPYCLKNEGTVTATIENSYEKDKLTKTWKLVCSCYSFVYRLYWHQMTHEHTDTHEHEHIHTHMHTDEHIRLYTHKHTHTHTHMHTHTHTTIHPEKNSQGLWKKQTLKHVSLSLVLFTFGHFIERELSLFVCVCLCVCLFRTV